MTRFLLLLAAGLLCGQAVLAQPAQPPADPRTVQTQADGWLIQQSTWTQGAERRDLTGGRIQAQLGLGRWALGLRGDATGLPGEYQTAKPETVRAVELHVAVDHRTLALPGRVVAGPAAVVGAAAAIETQDGHRPVLPRSATLGLGLRASWRGGWALLVAGQHQSLRGVAVMATWQVSASDRVATVGTVACGSRACVATTGVAARLW